jgi:urease accessory protein
MAAREDDFPQGSPPAGWLVALLQLNDTFYPTGAYAHSFGLEGLVAENVVFDRESLRGYLTHSVLPTLARMELPLALHAWQALGVPDWPQLRALAQLSSALKTSREARQAADAIGRQRVELCARLRGHPLAATFAARAKEEHWPHSPALAAALEARVIEAPVDAALASLYYANVAGVLAAAMKVLRIGQNGAQSLLTEMMSHAPRVMAQAREVGVDEIGWFNPWLDIAAARHETAASRLFIS